ncbi:MAG TPA: hypothetical protein VKT73_14130 [Xanthobacteraceae bacterium]|nr:hypothetical protein [Xanthobacteraceae bacterium]
MQHRDCGQNAEYDERQHFHQETAFHAAIGRASIGRRQAPILGQIGYDVKSVTNACAIGR